MTPARPAALVTGASGAIGAAIARALAAQGCRVILHCNKNVPTARRLAAGISAPTAVFSAELCEEQEIERLFCFAEERFGGVDILINNAGAALPQQLTQETSSSDFDLLFALDVRAPFLCSRRALPHMLRQGYGRIINISSVWGVAGASCEVAYSAAKAALIGMTKALAKETAPAGVTVNCVAPGVIESPMNAHLPPEDLAGLAAQTPAGRLGTPEDVAAAVSFFSGGAAGFTTGQVLLVDGGFAG